MAKKRAGRPVGELGLKSAVLSLRLPKRMRVALASAATRNGRRSVSEEIVIRLNRTLAQDWYETVRPRHVRGLLGAVMRLAWGLEQKTERAWTEDRYTAERLSRGIDLLIYTYSRGEVVIPPSVAAEAEARAARHPEDVRFADHLGEIEAGGLISALKAAPEPPDNDMGPGAYYPESWWGLWQIEQDLTSKPRRRK